MKLKMGCIYYAGIGDWRGGAAGLKNMLNVVSRIGIEAIAIISYSYDSDKFKVENANFRFNNSLIDSVIIHTPSNLPRFLKSFSTLIGLVYAWKLLRKCDIIFAHLSISSVIPAVVIGKILKKVVIFHFIDVELLPIPDMVYKVFLNYSDIIFAISPYLVKKAKEWGCKNIIFLPPFVNTTLFKLSTNFRKKVRKELGIEDEAIVIGYTGSFSFIEGVPVLLQAFKNLCNKYPRLRMIIVGGRKSKVDDNIPRLVKTLGLEGKVKIVPPQPHTNVPKFLSACDILCCPKIHCEENKAAFPIKVIEYLSMGLPTVCSSVGGILNVIKNNVNGFLVKPSDVKSLEKTLEWIILNPKRARKIGQEGRRKVKKEYSFDAIEKMIKGIMSVITEKLRK